MALARRSSPAVFSHGLAGRRPGGSRAVGPRAVESRACGKRPPMRVSESSRRM